MNVLSLSSCWYICIDVIISVAVACWEDEMRGRCCCKWPENHDAQTAGIPVRKPPPSPRLGQVIFSLISLKGGNMIPPIDCCINVLPGDERWGVLCFHVIWLRSGWEKSLLVLLQCRRACDGHLEGLHFLCCLWYDGTFHWLYYSIYPLDMVLYLVASTERKKSQSVLLCWMMNICVLDILGYFVVGYNSWLNLSSLNTAIKMIFWVF